MNNPATPAPLNTHDFTALYNQHQRKIYHFIHSMVKDPEQAADLTQDTFVRVFNNLHRHDPAKGEVGSWIYKIAQNLALTALQQRQSRQKVVCRVSDEELHYRVDPQLCSFQPEAMDVKTLVLRELISRLEPIQREPIQLVYYRDFSYEQAAQQLGCSISGIKSRIFLGKQELRRLLARPKKQPVRFVSYLDRNSRGYFMAKEGQKYGL